MDPDENAEFKYPGARGYYQKRAPRPKWDVRSYNFDHEEDPPEQPEERVDQGGDPPAAFNDAQMKEFLRECKMVILNALGISWTRLADTYGAESLPKEFRCFSGFYVMNTNFNHRSHPEDWVQVIANGTGTKSTLQRHLSVYRQNPAQHGTHLMDSHADMMARRALVAFLYHNLQMLLNGQVSVHSILELNPNGVGFRMKPHLRLGYYVSKIPCGGSSVRQGYDTSHFLYVKDFNNKEITRRVCGLKHPSLSADAPFLSFFMSCSDKFAKWNVTGVQGALLSGYIEPIYVSKVIFGLAYEWAPTPNPDPNLDPIPHPNQPEFRETSRKVHNSLYGRLLKDAPDYAPILVLNAVQTEAGFCVNVPEIYFHDPNAMREAFTVARRGVNQFSFNNDMKDPIASNWFKCLYPIAAGSNMELTNSQTGAIIQGLSDSYSRISKRGFADSYLSIREAMEFPPLLSSNPPLSGITYRYLKDQSECYRQVKLAVFNKLKSNDLYIENRNRKARNQPILLPEDSPCNWIYNTPEFDSFVV